MKIVRSAEEMQALCRNLRQQGKTLGFAPTMGALHDGHLSLVRTARQRCNLVAASIFVNPTQFGPNEDFSKYPRTFERDSQMLESEKCDILFAPPTEEMYPPGASTFVNVEGLSEKLDGKSRPGHFRGVTTIVSKLFNIVQPRYAFFGQKDAAQCAVIKKMVADLNFDVEIVVCPIVREPDGLAMSSRNAYLDPQQRKQAGVLYRALTRVQSLADTGEADAARLIAAAREVFAAEPAVKIDYVEVVDRDTLDPLTDISHGALVAVAAYVGSTRLIDNVVLTGKGTSRGPA